MNVAIDATGRSLKRSQHHAITPRPIYADWLADLLAAGFLYRTTILWWDNGGGLGTFAELDAICPPHTILTSNTSSVPIIQVATATARPDKVMGTHFFNPVPVMRLLELVRALTTSDETLASLCSFGESLGKRMIVSKDRAGFIVNYLLVPYMLDAIRMIEQGFASREDIDVGMMLGTSYPMGPLTLLDYVGLDTTLSITKVFFDEFKETQFAAPGLLSQMVAAGCLAARPAEAFITTRPASSRQPRADARRNAAAALARPGAAGRRPKAHADSTTAARR